MLLMLAHGFHHAGHHGHHGSHGHQVHQASHGHPQNAPAQQPGPAAKPGNVVKATAGESLAPGAEGAPTPTPLLFPVKNTAILLFLAVFRGGWLLLEDKQPLASPLAAPIAGVSGL